MRTFEDAQLFGDLNGQEPNWAPFDALELHGAVLVEMGDHGNYAETGASSDDAELYVVLAHLRTGGTESITEVVQYADAVEIIEALSKRSGLPARLHVGEPPPKASP